MPLIPVQHTIDTPYQVGPVHCYTLDIESELTLIDTGPPTDTARQYLKDHIDLSRLHHVIMTHCHIDHYGLAHWLEQETGATIYLPFRDQLKISQHKKRLQLLEQLFRRIGFDDDFIAELQVSLTDGSIFPPFPQAAKIVEQDLPPRIQNAFRVVPCPGHSQSDLVLVGDGWAISGDTMLEGIFQTPLLDVDLLTGERFCNYAAYCDSLKKLVQLRGLRIFPGHRQTVTSVDDCLLFYIGKFLDRARLVQKFPRQMKIAELIAALLQIEYIPPFVGLVKASEIMFIRDFLGEPERLRTVLEEIGLFAQVEGKFMRVMRGDL